MSNASEPVSVHILDREYTVGVEAGERASLMAAAKLLDLKMREVRGGNRMAAVDRVAVLAALNLAHELQQLRDANSARERELARAIEDLNHRLDRALGQT
ncbi:MAG TPA: cell division protein ZapA [Pseudoxanthomonas sp.]|nr:cell division protein ZapA [Pseudoxanthomonas sp.]